MKYPRPVFSKSPYRENVPICRIADHTVLVEDSHDFLYEEMLKLLNLFRHGSQQSCYNGNQHACSFSNIFGLQINFLIPILSNDFKLLGVFLKILIIRLSLLRRIVEKKTLRYMFSRATKDQLNAHRPDNL